MKKLQTFAASGSCFAPEKIIIGKVIDKITFISDEFTGTWHYYFIWWNGSYSRWNVYIRL